jgi:hypothetical protein
MAGELDKNLELAHSMREKVELYTLTLAFTLLAFSMQTGKLDSSVSSLAQVAELVAWLLFFFSSAIGLWRAEYIAPLMSRYAEINRLKGERANVLDEQARGIPVTTIDGGQPLPMADAISELGRAIESLQVETDKLSDRILLGGRLHVGLLFLGIAALFVARGYDPIRKLVGQLLMS